MSRTPRTIAIIGGGPAGLRAAEVAAAEGAFVTVFDAKPSVGRKFLVAGKSGLNITNNTEFEPFVAQYSATKDLPMSLNGANASPILITPRWRNGRCRSASIPLRPAGGKVFP